MWRYPLQRMATNRTAELLPDLYAAFPQAHWFVKADDDSYIKARRRLPLCAHTLPSCVHVRALPLACPPAAALTAPPAGLPFASHAPPPACPRAAPRAVRMPATLLQMPQLVRTLLSINPEHVRVVGGVYPGMSFPFVSGGASYALTRPAVAAILPHIEDCNSAEFRNTVFEDVMVCKCLQLHARVPYSTVLVNQPGFNWMQPIRMLREKQFSWPKLAAVPITYHYITPVEAAGWLHPAIPGNIFCIEPPDDGDAVAKQTLLARARIRSLLDGWERQFVTTDDEASPIHDAALHGITDQQVRQTVAGLTRLYEQGGFYVASPALFCPLESLPVPPQRVWQWLTDAGLLDTKLASQPSVAPTPSGTPNLSLPLSLAAQRSTRGAVAAGAALPTGDAGGTAVDQAVDPPVDPPVDLSMYDEKPDLEAALVGNHVDDPYSIASPLHEATCFADTLSSSWATPRCVVLVATAHNYHVFRLLAAVVLTASDPATAAADAAAAAAATSENATEGNWARMAPYGSGNGSGWRRVYSVSSISTAAAQLSLPWVQYLCHHFHVRLAIRPLSALYQAGWPHDIDSQVLTS
jgi:hypothetical protein